MEHPRGPTVLQRIGANLGGLATSDLRVRSALTKSLFDGIFATVMIALIETFAVAAAVSLRAPAFAIGILGSLPLFVSSVAQLVLPFVVNPKQRRKYYVIRAIFLQACFLLLCAASGLAPRPWGAYLFVAAFVLYGASGASTSALWMAWMRNLVPSKYRGRHFAWRNRFFAVTHLVVTLTAGYLSRKFTAQSAPWTLYAIVFGTAGVSRFISWLFISSQYEPDIPIEKPTLSAYRVTRAFGFYVGFVALLMAATSMAGPFFNVWYLRDLKFNYLTFALVSSATILSTLIFLPLWGKMSDRIGNFSTMRMTALMLSVVPLPYLFVENPYLILLINFYSGFCWSGFNLANFNYLLDVSGEEHPDQKISLAIAISGVAVFAFGLLGGFLATRLPILFHWQLRSLFLLSSILRLLVSGVSLRLLAPHVGLVPKEAHIRFHAYAGYRAGMGLLRNTFRAFRRL